MMIQLDTFDALFSFCNLKNLSYFCNIFKDLEHYIILNLALTCVFYMKNYAAGCSPEDL